MPVAFEVESEREVPVSVNRGVPLALSNPRASIVKSLGEMADTLVPLRGQVGRRRQEVAQRPPVR